MPSRGNFEDELIKRSKITVVLGKIRAKYKDLFCR